MESLWALASNGLKQISNFCTTIIILACRFARSIRWWIIFVICAFLLFLLELGINCTSAAHFNDDRLQKLEKFLDGTSLGRKLFLGIRETLYGLLGYKKSAKLVENTNTDMGEIKESEVKFDLIRRYFGCWQS
jgi:hypothetical protein